MKLNAYCVFDTASGVYQRPYFCGADGEATRMFVDLVAEKDHPVGKHPEDYSVFRVGSFNDTTGVLVGDEVRECLITGQDVLAMSRKDIYPDLSDATPATIEDIRKDFKS